MITNFYVACKNCGCTFHLRYYVSEEISRIFFPCPDCKTPISGTFQTVRNYGDEVYGEWPWHFEIKVNNLRDADEGSIESCKHVIRVHPEV